jgi:hypothetical protein
MIVSGSAVAHVIIRFTGEPVVIRLSAKVVIPRSSKDPIIANPATYHVIPQVPSEQIFTVHPKNQVMIPSANQVIIEGRPDEVITIAGARDALDGSNLVTPPTRCASASEVHPDSFGSHQVGNGVGATPARQHIVAAAAIEHVRAGPAEQAVSSPVPPTDLITEKAVRSAAPRKRVLTETPLQGVRSWASADNVVASFAENCVIAGPGKDDIPLRGPLNPISSLGSHYRDHDALTRDWPRRLSRADGPQRHADPEADKHQSRDMTDVGTTRIPHRDSVSPPLLRRPVLRRCKRCCYLHETASS